MPIWKRVAAYGVYILIITFFAAATVFLSDALSAISSETTSLSTLTLVSVGFLAIAPFALVSRLPGRDWFNPFALPLVYVTVSLFAPVLFLTTLLRPLASLPPSAVSPKLVMVFLLTVLGMTVGIVVSVLLTRRARVELRQNISYPRMLLLGRALTIIALVARASSAFLSWGTPYGEGVVSFGLGNFLDNLASSSFFGGMILVVVANAHLTHNIWARFDIAAYLLFAVITLSVGSRGELIAPTLFVIYAHHTLVRRISLAPAMVMAFAAIFLFQGIAGVRSNTDFYGGSLPAIERVLTSVASPIYVTTELLAIVPSHYPHTNGSTYLAAMQRQLPGPLSVAMFGAPSATGTYVFRDLVGFDSPDAGVAFSLPSEGYLNFGMPGAFFVPLLVGLVLGYAFRKQVPVPTRALHLLYPVVVATLPLSLRSDALTQLKTVLYPILILYIAYRWIARSGKGSRPQMTSTSGRALRPAHPDRRSFS